MTIKEYDLVKVNISDLVFDSQNPNQMTTEQMRGLKKSMHKYGFLVPIIIDNKNRLVDGAHRAAIYKANDINEIPAFKIDLDSETDVKQLRQVLNKLRGVHDMNKDINEYAFINSQGKLDELTELLGQQEGSLAIFLDRHEETTTTTNTIQHNEDNEEEDNNTVVGLEEKLDIDTKDKCPRCGYEW